MLISKRSKISRNFNRISATITLLCAWLQRGSYTVSSTTVILLNFSILTSIYIEKCKIQISYVSRYSENAGTSTQIVIRYSIVTMPLLAFLYASIKSKYKELVLLLPGSVEACDPGWRLAIALPERQQLSLARGRPSDLPAAGYGARVATVCPPALEPTHPVVV